MFSGSVYFFLLVKEKYVFTKSKFMSKNSSTSFEQRRTIRRSGKFGGEKSFSYFSYGLILAVFCGASFSLLEKKNANYDELSN